MRHSLQVMAASRPTSTNIQPPAPAKDQPALTTSLSDAPKIALPKNIAQTLQFLSDDDLETLRVSVNSELERRCPTVQAQMRQRLLRFSLQPQQRPRDAGTASSILKLQFLRQG